MSYSSHARFWRSLAIVTAKRSFKRSSQNCNMTLPGSELNLSNPRPRWRWPGISLAATALAWWTYGARHVLMLQWQNTPKHVKALTVHCLPFIYLTLFRLLICFLYFWIEAASLFLTMDPKISETFLNCLFEALHEAPGLGKTAMLAEFARFCIYPGAKIEIDSDRPCFSVQERPKGTRTEQARVICTRK